MVPRGRDKISQTNKETRKSKNTIKVKQGSEVIKVFSTDVSMKFILLINDKILTIVGILTFISMINTISERLKARNFFICQYFSFL